MRCEGSLRPVTRDGPIKLHLPKDFHGTLEAEAQAGELDPGSCMDAPGQAAGEAGSGDREPGFESGVLAGEHGASFPVLTGAGGARRAQERYLRSCCGRCASAPRLVR